MRRIQRGIGCVAAPESPAEAIAFPPASGAALCATDGTGTHASLFKWSHDSTEALEIHFDLHKDWLPILSSRPVLLDRLRAQVRLQPPEGPVPPQAGALLSKVFRALGWGRFTVPLQAGGYHRQHPCSNSVSSSTSSIAPT
jgi:hypothetical protein